MTNNVIPARITEARETRAMSMGDLAQEIGVSRQSISKYENGISGPSPETLNAISVRLDFPLDFFYKAGQDNSASNTPLFFRSKASIAKKVQTACAYQVKWMNEVKTQLETYVDFVQVDVPTIDEGYENLTLEDVEELALSVRKDWGLGEEPIGDLIGVLENRGILVSEFSPNDSCDFKGIDAFSCWKDGTPYILYHPVQKSAVRTRFSILHELGHLIMHSFIPETDALTKRVADFADEQADRFAAAFLLPSTPSSFPRDIRSTSLYSLESVKRKWGAAMSTIIKRCETLDLLTESQISYLKRQMTMKKYWRKEPLDDILTIESPEVIRDAIYLLIDSHILTKAAFIRSCALSIRDLKHLCGLPEEFFSDYVERRKPMLRLIKP